MSTATVDTPAAWEEYLQGLTTPETFMADLDSGEFRRQVSAYVEAGRISDNTVMADIRAQAREQAQQILAETIGKDRAATLSQGGRVPRPRSAAVPGGKHAPGASLDGVFSDWADYARAMWHKNTNPTEAQNEQRAKVFAYSEKIPADGGFLVPEEFRTEIMEAALENSIVRPQAQVVPMGSETLSYPSVDVTTHVGSLYGGVIVYRTEEAGELVESGAKFKRIKLEATKQTALAHVPNELISDTGGAIVGFIQRTFPNAMAYFEDLDYISGSGAGEPLGGLSAQNTALITVDKETGQAADTIVWENCLSIFQRFLPMAIEQSEWLITRDAFKELATMGLVVGTGGGPVWMPDLSGRPAPTLLGRPIRFSEKAPGVLGDVGDINLVDWSHYLVGDRMQMEMTFSPHVKFTSDQTSIRVIARNDGRPWLTNAITPQNGGPSLSAFVNLAARA